MPKYTVEYWEHIACFRDIEADSPEEAEHKMEELVGAGKIDMFLEGEVGDSGIECIGETQDDKKA